MDPNRSDCRLPGSQTGWSRPAGPAAIRASAHAELQTARRFVTAHRMRFGLRNDSMQATRNPAAFRPVRRALPIDHKDGLTSMAGVEARQQMRGPALRVGLCNPGEVSTVRFRTLNAEVPAGIRSWTLA